MSLLANIKELAIAKGMTIAELERKLNLSQGSIRKWDTTNPGIDKVQSVADFFGVSIDELLGREENTKHPN
ncbi:MAG: helix-turn-helix transcriptional regulator, partial [Psychrobacillus sp.]